ncbi:MAG: FIST C-terminal domain-containing protein [Synergistaceae bacterium]|nr:FIST C-terminal domain-containing protein [Synergistaceae bacterium]
MLEFNSASVRIADGARAVDECFEIMYGDQTPPDGGLWIVNAVIGHKLEKIASAIRARIPSASVLGSSCGGIVGREGAGESMTHMAVMTVNGPPDEVAWSAADDFHADSAYQKGLTLAGDLKGKLPGAKIIYLLTPGLDSRNDELLRAFHEVFGKDIVIFGGASSDNYKGVVTSQYIGGKACADGVWAVGFADASLKSAARATHGFSAYGDPMTVTKADRNFILELDGQPAWTAYSQNLGDISADDVKKVLVSGGLAISLDPALAREYGSACILRMGLPQEDSGAIRLSVSVKEGDQFYFTTRDEDLIFSEQKKALDALRRDMISNSKGDPRPAAVFQTDCLLRGRTLFDKVMKDEIIGMMQNAFSIDGEIPPWLGMYGFGEFCPTGGQNLFHTYTTSLLVLYR